MTKSLQTLVILAIFGLSSAQDLTKYREELEKKYPGYGTEFVFLQDDNGKPIKAYLRDNRLQPNFLGFGGSSYNVKTDINYTFYSRNHLGGQPISQKKDFKTYIDKTKPTKFVTHGWMSNGKKDSCVSIKDGFLDKYDANVIIMDWSKISKDIMYPTPMKATVDVGKEYAESINYLIKDVGVKHEDIHLVGHSLGAHVSGYAGRNVLGGKIARITALDPALPGFNIDKSIKTTDANFVDVIHTCAGLLGFKVAVGHVDFYPNRGKAVQPGCKILELLEACSHGRSWKIFASSLFQKSNYMAAKCSDIQQAMDKERCQGEGIPIGDPTPKTARGIYDTDIPREKLLMNKAIDDNYL